MFILADDLTFRNIGAYPQSTWVYPEVKGIVHQTEPLDYRVVLTGK